MPLDPSIILAGANPPPQYGPSPQQLTSMAEVAARLRLIQQQNRGINALRQLYSDPENVANGMLTPEATTQLFQADPTTALKYTQTAAGIEEQQMRMKGLEATFQSDGFKYANDIADRMATYYKEQLENGIPSVAAANNTMQQFAPEQEQFYKSGLAPAGFRFSTDPQHWIAASMTYPAYMAWQQKQKSQDLAERREAADEAKGTVFVGQNAQGQNVQFRYGPDGAIDPDTKIAVDTTGLRNIQRLGAPQAYGNLLNVRVADSTGGVKIVPAEKNRAGDYVDPETKQSVGRVLSVVGPRDEDRPGNVPLSSNALDVAAQTYLMTGQMPSMGWSGQERSRVLNRAGELAAQAGLTPAEVVAMHGATKSDFAALLQLGKLRANVQSFEDTADRVAARLLQVAPSGVGGSVPIFNRWIQAGRASIAGDPQVSRFNDDVTTLKNEYARIMSSPGATGGTTSDAARREADTLVNNASTLAQLRAQVDEMRGNMQRRLKAIDDNYNATRQRIAGGEISAPTGGAPVPSGIGTVPAQPGAAGSVPAWARTAPRVGDVRNGYRYRGGDPALSSSWVRAQ